MTLTLRSMTASEYTAWRGRVERNYAAEQVALGRWREHEAPGQAHDLLDRFLPHGATTPGMLILRAQDDEGAPVGDVWLGMNPADGPSDTAFLYDIEVLPERRGRGDERLLLVAAEDAVRLAGRSTLELNVFGANRVAIRLYETGGYETMSRQMRKILK